MTLPSAELVLGAAALAVGGLLYVTPLLVAASRDVVGLPRLVHLNVFLGWTGVVWVYCLLAALRRSARRKAAATTSSSTPRPPLQDRMPDWVRDLPPTERTWRSLPRDTAPLLIDDPEDR